MDSFSVCILLFVAAQSLGQWEYFWSVLIIQAAVSMTNGSPAIHPPCGISYSESE